MPLRYLKDKATEQLRSQVGKNLARYRNTGFDDYFEDLDEATRPLSALADPSGLTKLDTPTDQALFDAENSALVYSVLKDLSPVQAREERLWTFLCHFTCLDYVRQRWPIPDDDQAAIKHVLTHFFARSARAIERDNAVARLWWMGMLAGRADGLSRSEALEVLMYRADVRANIIERPTTGASVPVFSAVLRKLKLSYDGKKLLHERSHFRNFMKEINSAGGVLLLDTLSAKRLDKLLERIIVDRLGLGEI